LLAQPVRRFAGACRNDGQRTLEIVVVEDIEGVMAAITRLIHAPNDVGDGAAVNPFPGKDPTTPGSLNDVIKRPQVVRELNEDDLLDWNVARYSNEVPLTRTWNESTARPTFSRSACLIASQAAG
jgi:hypothetical protein